MVKVDIKSEGAEIKREEAENLQPSEEPPTTTSSGIAASPIKKEVKQEEYSEDKAMKIVQQVEYYFGNINLPRDKFLQGEMKKEIGWIPLTTMLKFNRLAKLTEDIEEIAKALEESTLIEVSESHQKIRRSQDYPLPDNTLEYWQEIKRRTAYVKGFPQDSTLDEIIQFLNQFDATQNVSLRHTKTTPRVFKGSVFVTFAAKETTEKFVSDEEIKEYKGEPLVKLMQEVYFSNKNKQRKEKQAAEKNLKQNKKAQTIEEQKQSLAATRFVKGNILKVTGIPPNTTVQSLKDFLNGFGDVGYVAIGETEAQIRFNNEEEDKAQEAWNKAVESGIDGKVFFDNAELCGEVLTGEDEQKYWDDYHKQKIGKVERMEKSKNQKRGRDKGNRDDGRSKKRAKIEDVGKTAKRTVFKDEDDDGEEEAVNNTNGDSKPAVGMPEESKTAAAEEVKTEASEEVKTEVNGP